MSIVWDEIGDHQYESGVDRGVLYLTNDEAVPWNGLTSITEKPNNSSTPIYFDGRKISDLVQLGSFSATMKAYTYPDEFEFMLGATAAAAGVHLMDQPIQTAFALSYRTRIGNDLEGDEAGYKLHVLYNVTAITKDRPFNTNSDAPSLVDFEWDITAIPEDVPGYRPTAHVIINSLLIDPVLLSSLEDMLYGTGESPPSLITLPDLIDYLSDFHTIAIIDHGDGTWSAVGPPESFSFGDDGPGSFTIYDVDAVVLDPDTYEITDTL